ncbi:MAG: hypothetical protein AAGF24_09945, partial [Cyanobacteria bacterium P01_H01_bin.121]
AECPGDFRHQAWKVMRELRRFNRLELISFIEIDGLTKVAALTGASKYLQALSRSGYLRRFSRDVPVYWQLLRNTGPVAPIPVDRKVYDPNLEQFFDQE